VAASLKPMYVRFHKREDFADTMSAGVSKKKMYYSERDKMIMKPLKSEACDYVVAVILQVCVCTGR